MSNRSTNQSLFETAANIYESLSPKSLIKRCLFLLKAFKNKSLVEKFIKRIDAYEVPVTSEMLGTIIWPYIHNAWNIETKLNTIADHYEILSPQFPQLAQIRKIKRFKVSDFSHISENLTIDIDYAQWFTREGEFVINIFQDDLRVASMAVTMAYSNDEVVAYIGAVQGIHGGVSAEKSLEIYKKLTKEFSGLRPRSLLLEVLKVVVVRLGAKKILGVSEQNRHHRHSYFGNDEKTQFKNDYNPFWDEHGGQLAGNTGFYSIPLTPAIRDLSEIAAKKRGQYRRRYEFIESISDSVNLA